MSPGTGSPGRLWQSVAVTASTSGPAGAPRATPAQSGPTLIGVPAVADLLGVQITKVHQLIRERTLLDRRVGGVRLIPAEFITDGLVLKGLRGTITLLTDAGLTDDEIFEWLFAADDSLPGTPIQALRENRGREVHRRAQVGGY